MNPEQIERVFGHGRLRMVTGEHVEVYREAAAPGERRRYTKRFLETGDADFRQWTEREWRILARLIGHGVRCVPDVVQFDGGAAGVRQVQTYDAGITVDQWGTLLPVARNGAVHGHIFQDCAHWWALAHHCLAALDEIHALQLVHLDIKADNICIPYEPATFDAGEAAARLNPSFARLTLIDFAFSLVSREKLRTALPLGWQKDFDYQSPRLLRALEAGRDGDLKPTQDLDWRCDLYSLAAMLRRYLPDDEWVRGEGGAAGWTTSRYSDARSLIYRLRECHDRDLPEVRPHRALMEVTGAHLNASDLARSLSYGWSIAHEHEGEPTTALITPMTRIAPPRATVQSPVLGPDPAMITAMPEVFRHTRMSVVVAPRDADDRPPPRQAKRRAARVAVATMAVASLVASAAWLWHDGLPTPPMLSSVTGSEPQPAAEPERLASREQPAEPPAPGEVTPAQTSPLAPAEAPAPVPATPEAPSSQALATGPTTEESGAQESAATPSEPVHATESGSESVVADEAPQTGSAPEPVTVAKPEREPAATPPATSTARSPPAKRGNSRSARAPGAGTGSSTKNARVASAPRPTASPHPQTFVAKANTSVAPVVAAPHVETFPASSSPVAEANAPAGTSAAAPASEGPTAPAKEAPLPATPPTASAVPAPAPAESPNARAEPPRSVAPRMAPLQLHEPWRSVLRDMLAALGVAEQRAAPVEERSIDRPRATQDRPRSVARPPAMVASAPAAQPQPQASAETSRAVLPPPLAAVEEHPDPAPSFAARPAARPAPTVVWSDSADGLRAEGKRMLAEDVPRVAAQARADVSTVLAIAAAAQEPAQERAVANAAFSRWSSERWSLSAASPSRGRDFHVYAKRAFASGRDDDALDLALQSFAANPRDADAAGLLALLYLRAKPAQPETARQLALHALALSGSNRIHRLEDWHTFAVASALSGRELDAWRGLLVELALSNDVERTCRAAINAYASYGERLRPPVQGLLQRVHAQGRDYNAPSCAWTPYRTANAW